MDDEWEARKDASAKAMHDGREAGRRKAGVAGAALAGMMLAMQEIYEGPLPEQLTIVADADGDPEDPDVDGMSFSIQDSDVWAPPIEPPNM